MICFRFPVVTFFGDDPEDSEIEYQEGQISSIRASAGATEAILTAFGKTYYIIIGTSKAGRFLCIPDHRVGCFIEASDRIEQNLNAVLENETQLDYEESTAIAFALSEIG